MPTGSAPPSGACGIQGEVVRGGSFNNHRHNARCGYRNNNHPHHRHNNLGFRVVVVFSHETLALNGRVPLALRWCVWFSPHARSSNAVPATGWQAEASAGVTALVCRVGW